MQLYIKKDRNQLSAPTYKLECQLLRSLDVNLTELSSGLVTMMPFCGADSLHIYLYIRFHIRAEQVGTMTFTSVKTTSCAWMGLFLVQEQWRRRLQRCLWVLEMEFTNRFEDLNHFVSFNSKITFYLASSPYFKCISAHLSLVQYKRRPVQTLHTRLRVPVFYRSVIHSSLNR